jgi:hypothetical protein
MPDILTSFGGVRAILTVGGPVREISVRGKRWRFEMHSYCGPMLMDLKGDALKREPGYVLNAISLWAQQGQRLEQRPEPNPPLCVWDHEPEPILKWVSKRTAIITGYHPAKRGE